MGPPTNLFFPMVKFILYIFLTFGCLGQSETYLFPKGNNFQKINKAAIVDLIQIEEINPNQLGKFFDKSYHSHEIAYNYLFPESTDSSKFEVIGKTNLFKESEIISILVKQNKKLNSNNNSKEIICMNIKNDHVYSSILLYCDDEISENFLVSWFDRKNFKLEITLFCPKEGINSRSNNHCAIILDPIKLLLENTVQSKELLTGTFNHEKLILVGDTAQAAFLPQ